MFERIYRFLKVPTGDQVQTVAGVLARYGAQDPLSRRVARAALHYRSTDPRERYRQWVEFRGALRASGIREVDVERVASAVVEALDPPKAETLKAPERDRAVVADVMVSFGVPYPDARDADRIAIAARRVSDLVNDWGPLEPGARAALDAAHAQLRRALTEAGWTPVGSAGPAAAIVRRLREES